MQITSLDFYADYFTKPRPGNFRLMVEWSHSWDGLKLQLNLGLLCRGQMTLFGTFSFLPGNLGSGLSSQSSVLSLLELYVNGVSNMYSFVLAFSGTTKCFDIHLRFHLSQ